MDLPMSLSSEWLNRATLYGSHKINFVIFAALAEYFRSWKSVRLLPGSPGTRNTSAETRLSRLAGSRG
jgi:hypothetical protein